MKSKFFVFILLFLYTSQVMAGAFLTQSVDGAKSIQYFPEKIRWWKSYPLLIALHGKRGSMEQTCRVWKPVADHFKMILLCPQGSDFEEGYIRTPVDDRKIIKRWVDSLNGQYRLRRDKTVLVGFSRGGNFAIELAAMYPNVFPNTVSFFGFFNRGVKYVVRKNSEMGAYSKSKIIFATGKGDYSQTSNQLGHRFFASLGIKSQLMVFKDLKHDYPPLLIQTMSSYFDWFYDGTSFWDRFGVKKYYLEIFN